MRLRLNFLATSRGQYYLLAVRAKGCGGGLAGRRYAEGDTPEAIASAESQCSLLTHRHEQGGNHRGVERATSSCFVAPEPYLTS